jgi:hypothetical protein
MLQCRCFRCGSRLDYISEQVGTTADCPRCGKPVQLIANPIRVTLRIVWATLVVLALVGAQMFIGTTARPARCVAPPGWRCTPR